MDHNEKLDIIKKTYSDTKFVLDKPDYANGIKSITLYWLASLGITNFILFLFICIAKYLNFWGTDFFFKFHNILFMCLNLFTLLVYLSFLKNKNISLKEKHFLKLFAIIPLLVFISKVIFPISFYFNFEFLLALYDSIALDLIATLIGTIMFYNYFKEKKYIFLSLLTIIYIAIASIIKIFSFNLEEIHPVLIKLFNLVDFINAYSIFIVFIFCSVVCLISKREYNE